MTSLPILTATMIICLTNIQASLRIIISHPREYYLKIYSRNSKKCCSKYKQIIIQKTKIILLRELFIYGIS